MPYIGTPLLHQSINWQLQKLIVEPIVAIRKDPNHPVLIVVDVLDECNDANLISQLMKAITATNFLQLPILFLFTSRSEDQIRIIFHTPTTHTMTCEFSLLAINADQDIQLFL